MTQVTASGCLVDKSNGIASKYLFARTQEANFSVIVHFITKYKNWFHTSLRFTICGIAIVSLCIYEITKSRYSNYHWLIVKCY